MGAHKLCILGVQYAWSFIVQRHVLDKASIAVFSLNAYKYYSIAPTWIA